MSQRSNENFCQNCGKQGHVYQQCKIPITSFGIICFRKNSVNNAIEYLMIRRKDTLGYVDFLRGKYSLYNKYYIINMLKQMTIQEKESLKNNNFDFLWRELWGENAAYTKYKNEENNSREKFNQLSSGVFLSSLTSDGFDINESSRWITRKESNNISYSLESLIEETKSFEQWEEQEWGFPKGRRNYQEKELDCALREFSEETGYNSRLLKNIDNILPFEEIFMGSNYKSYKHKYFLMSMNYLDSLKTNSFEKTEVSKIEWKSYEECLNSIRDYNLEKKKIIMNINKCLSKYLICKAFE
jgi:8-oxo-dGTP pyrophosphatase MutT (NUDIX family)